jgi:hypothetical protein
MEAVFGATPQILATSTSRGLRMADAEWACLVLLERLILMGM